MLKKHALRVFEVSHAGEAYAAIVPNGQAKRMAHFLSFLTVVH